MTLRTVDVVSMYLSRTFFSLHFAGAVCVGKQQVALVLISPITQRMLN